MMLRDCRETFEDATLQDEDGGRGYEPRNVSGLWKLEKAGNGFFPTTSRKE